MDREQLDVLRELVEFLKANDIAEFDVEREDVKLRLKFAGPSRVAEELPQQSVATPVAGAPMATQASFPVQAEVAHAHAVAPAATALATPEEVLHQVKSPIVGTFYESSAPGAAAFVNIGDQVESGQVLCIVEAMKLMNEIEADVAGEIVSRIAVPGQPVEYGQPLFSLRPR
jgi:acetyl-CoA carboxylase biotin carboxyl carrier protein